ncbi:nucleoside kinase [Nocardiopsis tropica]|uniref:Nucleoside kinase n=1 Tax=Nocardiopsis tropica TaxID=109330 RepID=A0ABU7KP75_9ACTN|nr:nucleoside kinase [Nocardiopsis umidischolae]MEE2051103.1 nucleoside kinase [Nocardiopsis umidischolae]
MAFQGNPETGEPTDGFTREHHIRDIGKVRSLAADQDSAVTFFCGGSRNFSKFLDLFDSVFVLEVDLETLHRRLDERPDEEWGGKQEERNLIVRLHRTKEDISKDGVVINATEPLARVVDEIVHRSGK